MFTVFLKMTPCNGNVKGFCQNNKLSIFIFEKLAAALLWL